MQNVGLPAIAQEAAVQAENNAPPDILVKPEDAPVQIVWSEQLQQMGTKLHQQFMKYKQDRRLAELKWLRNQRQYLGVYDPEIEEQLSNNRSKAYPKLTRIKTISTLSRIMNLMFPGNDRNWDLTASPNAEMKPEDVKAAVDRYMQKLAKAGVGHNGGPPMLSEEDIQAAVQDLANERAEALKKKIDDQLQELGGDQSYDYIALNRQMLLSGIMYGIGVLSGPYVKQVARTTWVPDGMGGFAPQQTMTYKPVFDWVPIWDFYPDFSAKKLANMDGWFRRHVMSRAQLRKLADRPDFFPAVIKKYLADRSQGNYKPELFETELRVMGVKQLVNEQTMDGSKYEVVAWNGTFSATALKELGLDVPDEFLGDDIEAEIWMVENYIIKADINPWRKLGIEMNTCHTFIFDDDDTSPVGNGLPNVIRDSQMSLCAAVRMMLDNASVVCGPNVEIAEKLLRPDIDRTSIHAYKVWPRLDDDPMTLQWPAVREIKFDSHLQELEAIVRLFLEFADAETFVGPLTGGDMAKSPSEPMRTVAGASMLRGDAALPFKDVIRNFDRTTQSIIYSLVKFNAAFNPDQATDGDFNVVARGATSLISKEVRGMQMDQLAVTLSDSDKIFIDEEELLRERLATRDAEHLMLPESEANIKKMQADQAQSAQQDLMQKQAEAQIRELLSASYKNITQGQKNAAAAKAEDVTTALALLEKALGRTGQEDAAGGEAPSRGGAPHQP